MTAERPSTRLVGVGAAASGANVRSHNLAMLLRILHLEGAHSRAQLTRRTGVNRSTVGELIGVLVELGLAEERGVATTPGPGRPSPVVRPCPRGAVVLAVELTVDVVASATIGLGGRVLGTHRTVRDRATPGPETVMVELTRQLLGMRSAWDGAPVLGVGVAVAGMINRSSGVVGFGPNLGWRGTPIGALLSDVLAAVGLPRSTPVALANEADLGARAESLRGAGRDVEDLVYVSGEVGIGVGVIAGGQPLLGCAGYAAEAGHMLVDPHGAVCSCGARGCWETEAGEDALRRRAGSDPGPVGNDAIDDLLARLAAGDPVVRAAVEETGTWLGLGFANLVNLFNPRLLVLGGLYHRLYHALEPSIRAAFTRQVLALPGELARIVVSELGEDALLIGAGELAFEPLLADPAGELAARGPG